MRDEWEEVYSAMETLRDRCVNGTAGIKHIYRRYLDKYERLNFLEVLHEINILAGLWV